MVDFANSNLCGASPEMNDLFKKLDEAAADIESNIDAAASEATAAFASAQNELNSLTAKLQSIEIPQLPKLNLQAEIKSLSELIPGTPEYLSSLATITKEFGADLEAAGTDLGTLISDGLSAITSGGNICNVVPNVEKEAGSDKPATEKATNVLQAAVAPETETVSKVTQNADIKEKVEEIANKVKNFAVGTSANPPTKDTPKFKFVLPSAFKTIQFSPTPQQLPQPSNIKESKSESAPKVVTPKIKNSVQRKNVIKKEDGDGFATRKASTFQRFSFAGLKTPKGFKTNKIDVVDGNYQFPLKHKPIRIIRIFAHLENVPKKLLSDGITRRALGDSDEAKELRALGLQHPSTLENKQYRYESYYGPHISYLLSARSDGSTLKSDKMMVSIFGNTLVMSTTLSIVDHPGNIDSGGFFQDEDPDNFSIDRYEETFDGAYIRGGEKTGSDKFGNKVFGNIAVIIYYEYLERYDPNYQP